MSSWTISRRITFGFVVLTVLAFIIGITAYIGFGMVETRASSLINGNMPRALILGQIKDNLSREYADVLNSIRLTPGSQAYKEEIQKIHDRLDSSSELWKEMDGLATDDEDRRFMDGISDTRKRFVTTMDSMLQFAESDDNEKAYAFLDSTFYKEYAGYRDRLQSRIDEERSDAKTMGTTVSSTISIVKDVIVIALISGLILSIGVAIVIIRGTNRVLEKSISSIDEGSAQVAAAASQVSAASNMLAEGASEQAASLEETSSSLEEMSSMTAHNATSAQEAKSVADEMRQAADSSSAQMAEMQKAMDAIKESSAGISQIIKTIDEIAFQTNILALNAAVEAARAGEAGAGFAVVAEEVRNLAQRSAESAKETSGKIEGAIRNSDRGVMISAKVAESLGEIVEKARKMNSLVTEIASASQEQDKGIGQLTTAVQQMDKVTQSNASNAEETASASEELNAHADLLKETVVDLVSLVRKTDAAARSTHESHKVSVGVKSAPVTKDKNAPARAVTRTPAAKHFLPMSSESSAKKEEA